MKNSKFEKLIETNDSPALLPVRVIAGLTLAAHGAQKLFGWFGGGGLKGTAGFFQEQLGLSPGLLWAFNAGAAEFFGGLLLMVGFLSRIGAGLNVIVMTVGILVVHRHAFFAGNGGMEHPLLLLAASIAVLVAGGGRFSVDRTIAHRSKSVASSASVEVM